MKYEVILELLFIFLFYSLIGWILEVVAVAIKEKKFVNRGVTNGPMCTIYGFCAVLMTLALNDVNNPVGLFIGSLIYGTAVEFITGKILERTSKKKWWDYSKKKFNLDGYICLQYSLLWGLLGVLLVKVFNPLFLLLFSKINIIIRTILVFVILGLLIIDWVTTFITIKYLNDQKFKDISTKFGNFILKNVQKRLEKAYPNLKKKSKVTEEQEKQKCGFYKLFIIFLVGAFVGDIVEIFFCRYTMGRFMSRSSLVWGQFSLVWGLAIALATLLLHRYQNKSNTFLFIFGTIMGGAFEYVCSVFTEFFFGTIFWDYSKIPFNINGRINLLYCFFWGFATIIFIKLVYPTISKWIEAIPKKIGKFFVTFAVIFMIIDLIVTGCVMMRYNTRNQGVEASNIVEKLCDKYADDEFMHHRWSNMKKPKK